MGNSQSTRDNKDDDHDNPSRLILIPPKLFTTHRSGGGSYGGDSSNTVHVAHPRSIPHDIWHTHVGVATVPPTRTTFAPDDSWSSSSSFHFMATTALQDGAIHAQFAPSAAQLRGIKILTNDNGDDERTIVGGIQLSHATNQAAASSTPPPQQEIAAFWILPTLWGRQRQCHESPSCATLVGKVQRGSSEEGGSNLVLGWHYATLARWPSMKRAGGNQRRGSDTQDYYRNNPFVETGDNRTDLPPVHCRCGAHVSTPLSALAAESSLPLLPHAFFQVDGQGRGGWMGRLDVTTRQSCFSSDALLYSGFVSMDLNRWNSIHPSKVLHAPLLLTLFRNNTTNMGIGISQSLAFDQPAMPWNDAAWGSSSAWVRNHVSWSIQMMQHESTSEAPTTSPSSSVSSSSSSSWMASVVWQLSRNFAWHVRASQPPPSSPSSSPSNPMSLSWGWQWKKWTEPRISCLLWLGPPSSSPWSVVQGIRLELDTGTAMEPPPTTTTTTTNDKGKTIADFYRDAYWELYGGGSKTVSNGTAALPADPPTAPPNLQVHVVEPPEERRD